MKLKLQATWDAKDIECGLYVIKNSSSLGAIDLSFACTVVFKVGFALDSGQNYGLISCLTDGMFMKVGDGSKEALVEYFNKDDFRPLRKSEYINLINSTKQGFIEY
jgi:hypothetical protein